MFDQRLMETPPEVLALNGRLLPFISNCYRQALQKLDDAYRASRPAAILVSNGRWAPNHVLDTFQDGIDEDAAVARIDRPCADATAFMQEILRSIGFDPSGMGLADLEKVLYLFLQHQRNNKRRTVIAIQYSDIPGWWVLDTVRRMVEQEAEQKFGLMVVLACPADASSVLDDPILDVINRQAGERIVLTPFSLTETLDFVRQCVAEMSSIDGSSEDVGRVFEFDSVSLIHEICAGVPDDVDKLCRKSLELVSGNENSRVSIDVVKDAASLANLSAELPETVADLPVLDTNPEAPGPGKLLIDSVGEDPEEIELQQGSILIGRDQLCGVCVAAVGISRFHGMILHTGLKVHFVDLNSTNGSCVNGEKVLRHSLQDNDVITIGSTRITYVAPDTEVCKSSAVDGNTGNTPTPDENLAMDSPVTRISRDLQLIRTS